MVLRLYNTLTRKIEIFKPLDKDNVRMYVCGPTIYGPIHIGNARPNIVFDVLYRLLTKLYNKVTYVRNVTDVDDKIYKEATKQNISMEELTAKTLKAYHLNMAYLNVIPPSIEPKATEHIDEMIRFIETLIQNGYAYESRGHIYFNVNSFKDYGKLSNRNIDDLLSGARVDISENKSDPLDFVLWKPISDEFNVGWDSPWGRGRPGWHIECSAMSKKYLGETFDIHGGGIDLVFPHHENEIAQTCACSGKHVMANYFVHNGHLTIDGSKMSKSLGNVVLIDDLVNKYDGEVIRLAILMTQFSEPLNFTESTLTQAKNILDKWYLAIKDCDSIETTDASEIDFEVFESLCDNLNTPKAISRMHKMIAETPEKGDRCSYLQVFINTARSLLGVMNKDHESWFRPNTIDRNWIEGMIQKRNIAKANKDYTESDRIRSELLEKGIILEDSGRGTTWRTK